MLSFLYVYSDHSILECYNLFSGVELSMRSFFVISVCSCLQSQCEVHGSLRTVGKQVSVNAKDLCDISFVST